MTNPELLETARGVMKKAQKAGCSQAAVSVSKRRIIDLEHRDDKLETIRESGSASLSLHVYADGRYSSHQTSDLRPAALDRFIDRSVAMTKYLAEDPHRHLADPELYAGRSAADLEIFDGGYESIDPDHRRKVAADVSTAARAPKGPIVSVETGYSDRRSEWVQVHSNGFEDGDRSTEFWFGASTSVSDGDKKPSDWYWVGTRNSKDLPDVAQVGKEATRRALGRIGQVKLTSATLPIVVENRVGGRLLRYYTRALAASALYQKRSFLLDKKGKSVGNERFTLIDDPLMPRGLGSRRFDGDGITATRRVLIDGGVLEAYLVDVYYGSKLKVHPNGASLSNVTIAPGDKSAEALIADVGTGLYVTSLLGGNADANTGDFSHGIVGFEITGGKIGRPIGEMNITGSHAELWNRLAAVGNDPYPYSTRRVPTLVFDGVSVSGA